MRSAAASETVLAAALRFQRASRICSQSRCASRMGCDATDSAAILLLRRRRHAAGSEQTSRPRRVRSVIELRGVRVLLRAAASSAILTLRSARDGRSASASPIWVFARRWTFRDFADVERITGPEIVLEERDLVLAPGLYFCKRSPGPPSSGRSPDSEDGGLITISRNRVVQSRTARKHARWWHRPAQIRDTRA